MKNHGFHGNRRFSRKKANFTENVKAVKSWIKLVPSDHYQLLHTAPDVCKGDEWGDCFLWREWPPIV